MNAAERELIHAQGERWKLERLALAARRLGQEGIRRDIERAASQARHIERSLRWICRAELNAN